MKITQNAVVHEVSVALGREIRDRVAEPFEDLQALGAGEGPEHLGDRDGGHRGRHRTVLGGYHIAGLTIFLTIVWSVPDGGPALELSRAPRDWHGSAELHPYFVCDVLPPSRSGETSSACSSTAGPSARRDAAPGPGDERRRDRLPPPADGKAATSGSGSSPRAPSFPLPGTPSWARRSSSRRPGHRRGHPRDGRRPGASRLMSVTAVGHVRSDEAAHPFWEPYEQGRRSARRAGRGDSLLPVELYRNGPGARLRPAGQRGRRRCPQTRPCRAREARHRGELLRRRRPIVEDSHVLSSRRHIQRPRPPGPPRVHLGSTSPVMAGSRSGSR